MERFRLLLFNELKLFRTAVPVHMVALIQPSILFLLMSFILVHPTFTLFVERPLTVPGEALVDSMRQVGAPNGISYISVELIDSADMGDRRQLITIDARDGDPIAIQNFGQVDSNLVKNYRNRLTAAALDLWQGALGSRSVEIEEHPWLPTDVPYPVYFGLALLPMAAVLAGCTIGGILMAQDFETGAFLEYRLAPRSALLLLSARLLRLVFFSILSTVILAFVVWLRTSYGSNRPLRSGAVLLVMAFLSSCVGATLGLWTRKGIPAFISGLCIALAGWIFGGGFALGNSFGGLYQRISLLTPNTHAVILMFPDYYGVSVGDQGLSAIILCLMAGLSVMIFVLSYRHHLSAER